MISPHRFTWGGMSSIDFNLITCLAFDGDNGETDTMLGREAVVAETYNGAKKYGHNYKWSNSFAPKLTLIKEGFGDFTSDENRKILSWLTSKQSPGFLTIYGDDSEVISFECLGNFIEVQQYKIGNGRIVGYVCTFESLNPYALSAIQSYPFPPDAPTKTINGPTTFTINCKTDDFEALIYPKITITEAASGVVEAGSTLGSKLVVDKAAPYSDGFITGTTYHYNGTWYREETVAVNGVEQVVLKGYSIKPSSIPTTSVVIENLTLGIKAVTRNNITTEQIIIDGSNKVVSSNRTKGRTFGNDFDWQWVPLKLGENQMRVTGNCEIKFEWREPRKVGDAL